MASAHCSSGFCNWSKDGCLRTHSSSSSSFFFFPSYHCPFPYWLLMSRLHVTIEWNDGLLVITKQCFLPYCLCPLIAHWALCTEFLFSTDALSIDPFHWRILFVASRKNEREVHQTNEYVSGDAGRSSASAHYEAGSSTLLQLIAHIRGKDGKRDMETYTHRQTDTHSERHSKPRSWSTLSSISWRTLLDVHSPERPSPSRWAAAGHNNEYRTKGLWMKFLIWKRRASSQTSSLS